MKKHKKEIYGYTLILTLILAPIYICKVSATAANRFVSNFQYGTIQEAINVATPGETIIIPAGLYQEAIIVNKTLTILGEDKLRTTIQKNNATDIVKIVANNVYFSGFTIRNGVNGITVASSDCTINDNIVFNNSIGIRLSKASNTTVSNNLINKTNAHPGSGIFLNESPNNLLSNNKIIDSGEGIYLRGSSNNTVIRNWLINNSKTGVCLMRTTIPTNHNIIRDNIIEGGATFGIDLYSGVSYNTIFNNTLKNIGFNLWIERANNNTFYHNTFIKSPKFYQVYSLESQNVWDNGFEGNYWSDHNWTDYDLYGILTMPYNISLRNPINKDLYPLRSPYLMGDANHDNVINTADAELLKLSWQSRRGFVSYSPYVDFNQDTIVNIKDVAIVGINWLKSQTQEY